MIDSCGVVVPTTGGFGECVVGVVYELEFTGAFCAFGRVCWDAVGVGFECCSGADVLVCVRIWLTL